MGRKHKVDKPIGYRYQSRKVRKLLQERVNIYRRDIEMSRRDIIRVNALREYVASLPQGVFDKSEFPEFAQLREERRKLNPKKFRDDAAAYTLSLKSQHRYAKLALKATRPNSGTRTHQKI